MLDDSGDGLFLEIGWVAVFAEEALDHGPEAGAGLFADGPVDAGVLADGLGDLAGNDQ